MVDNLRGEFDPHRHLCREASVRQYNGAGMFCLQFYLQAEHVLLIYNAQIYWRTEILCASKRCGPNQKKSRKLAKHLFLIAYSRTEQNMRNATNNLLGIT
jgi:hypothetical protein